MKVIQINSVCGKGSTGRIAVDLSQKMSENDIDNFIIYGIGTSDFPSAIKIGCILDLRMHQLHTRLLGLHGYSSKRGTKMLIDILEQEKPDVIHLHNIHGFYININMLFSYLSKINIPVIWTLHDCWSFTGHCAHFEYINCKKWITGCFKCQQKKSYPISWFIDNSKKQWCDKKKLFNSIKNLIIVTPSEWLANYVKESFMKDSELIVINNGIDLEIFKPQKSDLINKLGLNEKFIILGVASYWTDRKGLSHFLELSKKIDIDCIIILVGLTQKQKANLPKNIIGINKTNNIQELTELYSISNVFVNPTLEDTFPNVNIEAIACGTPVITFKTGGCPEIIDIKSGIIVERDNNEELLKAINKLKNQNINHDTCISHSKKFNKEDKFMDYINLYKNR